jgi:hypothetical protein
MTDMNFMPSSAVRPTGCLVRKTEFGKCCAVARERLQDIVQPSDWDDILAIMPGGCVDFSDVIGEIYDQNGYGSCAMESWTKGIEVAGRLAGYEVPTLNPWFGYGIAVDWRGGPRVGTAIDENFTLLQRVGACPASVWPRSKGPNKKPSDEAYAAALDHCPIEGDDCENIAEVGSELLERHPVIIGWHGHSELLIGLKPGQIVKVCGSYGSSHYNGSGFHDEPISAIDFQYGAIALRTVTDLGLRNRGIV